VFRVGSDSPEVVVPRCNEDSIAVVVIGITLHALTIVGIVEEILACLMSLAFFSALFGGIP
jgi:hypothetical protein